MPQGRYSYRRDTPDEYTTRMEGYRKAIRAVPEPEPESWGHWAARTVVPSAIRTVPAIAGGILGSSVGPGGTVGGGMLGAGIGSGAAQAYEKWMGTRDEISPGEMALDTALGGVPVAQGAKSLGMLGRAALHGAQGAGMGAASTVGTSLIQKGELPELEDVGWAALTGGTIGAGVGAFSGRRGSAGSVVEKDPGTAIGPPRNPNFVPPWQRGPRVRVEPVGPIPGGRAQPINPDGGMGPVAPPTPMRPRGPVGLPPHQTPGIEAPAGPGRLPQGASPYANIPDKELEGLVTFGDEDAWKELLNRGRVRPAGPSSLAKPPIPMGPSSLAATADTPLQSPWKPPQKTPKGGVVETPGARPGLGSRREIAPIVPEEPMGIGPVEEPIPPPKPVGSGRSLGALAPVEPPSPPGPAILQRAAMQVPPRMGAPVTQPPPVPGRPMSGPRQPMPGIERPPMGEVAPIEEPVAPVASERQSPDVDALMANRPFVHNLEEWKAEQADMGYSPAEVKEAIKQATKAGIDPTRSDDLHDLATHMGALEEDPDFASSIGHIPSAELQAWHNEKFGGGGARARRREQRGATSRPPFTDRLRDERGMVDLTGETGIPPVEPIGPRAEPVGDVPPVGVETEPPVKEGLGARARRLKQRLADKGVTFGGKETPGGTKLGSGLGGGDFEKLGQEARKFKRKAIWKGQDFGEAVGKRLEESRAYKAGLDVSAVLRQGGHFKTRPFFWKTLPQAWESLKSQEGAERVMKNIENHPFYKSAKSAGVYFSDESNLEESIVSKAAEYGPFSEGSKAAEKYQGTVGRAYKATNRFHSNFLNELRLRAFEEMSKGAKPEEIAGLAKYINSATGRGKLSFTNVLTGKQHDFEGAAKFLNKTFFSARFAKSRLDLMNPQLYAGKNAAVRKQAWRDLGANVSLVLAANGLAKAAGADVTMDPRSPDFGKIKVGSSRIDFTNGMQPYIRILAQTVSGKKTSSVTGQTQELNTGKFGAPTKLETLERFTEGKFAPLPAFATNYMRGKKVTGEDISYTSLNPLENEFSAMFTPMIVDDITSLIKHDPKAAWMAPFAALGDSVQTYGDQKKKKGGKGKNSSPSRKNLGNPSY